MRSGQRFGPVSSEQLKKLAVSGDIQPTDLVWTEGVTEWKPASRINGLFPDNPPTSEPPPLPPEDDMKHETLASLLTGRGGQIIGLTATLIGSICDFLRPLAPVTGWIFLASVTALFAFLTCWIRLSPARRRYWEQIFPHQCLAFSLIVVGGIGIWFAGYCIFPSEKNGILGDNIPAIAKLQETLLGIHSDIKDIKTDTESIKSDTTEILQETKRIGGSVDELGKLGGIVKNPATPAEFYHNARIHELGGDFKAAFKDYEKYITFNQDFVDPFESYFILLQSQQGNRIAEEKWQELRKKYPDNLALELVGMKFHALKERHKALDNFSKKHKDYIPIYWELGKSYSAAESPSRSKLDHDVEIENYQIIVDTNKDEFLGFYLDKNHGRNLIGLMQKTIGEYQGKNEIPPRVFAGLSYSQLLDVRINDVNVVDIEYSFDEKTWSKATDIVKGAHPPLVMEFYDAKVEGSLTADTIYVRYQDINGKWSKIFANPYNAPKEPERRKVLFEENKQTFHHVGPYPSPSVESPPPRNNDGEKKSPYTLPRIGF